MCAKVIPKQGVHFGRVLLADMLFAPTGERRMRGGKGGGRMKGGDRMTDYGEAVLEEAMRRIERRVLEARAKILEKSEKICGNCQMYYPFKRYPDTGMCFSMASGRGVDLIVSYQREACGMFVSKICPCCGATMEKEYLRSESTGDEYFRYICQECGAYGVRIYPVIQEMPIGEAVVKFER